MSNLSDMYYFRVNLLNQLAKDYFEGKESYQGIAYKINSLLQLITTLNEEDINLFLKYWGQIKLIEAEAIYDGKETLAENDKADFDSIMKNISLLTGHILNKSQDDQKNIK